MKTRAAFPSALDAFSARNPGLDFPSEQGSDRPLPDLPSFRLAGPSHSEASFPKPSFWSPAFRSAQQRPHGSEAGTRADASAIRPVQCEVETLSGLSLPPSTLQSADAATRILATVAEIERHLSSTVYAHQLRVDPSQGIYQFDCSLMVSWILGRAAPGAHAEISGLAGQYFSGIDRISPGQPTAGWRHVARIADTQPGDVIAWATPPGLPSHVSGHVVIAAGRPEPFRNGFLLRVVDSTSFPHGEDSRGGGSGFGYGTMYFEVDPQSGAGVGYGWTGRYSGNYVLRTRIAVGRPLS